MDTFLSVKIEELKHIYHHVTVCNFILPFICNQLFIKPISSTGMTLKKEMVFESLFYCDNYNIVIYIDCSFPKKYLSF